MLQTINPVSHIERWGFVVLMKLAAVAGRDLRYATTNCGVFR